ncbi:FG-GAP-like repeat-containing protein [Streptomyces griseiscabiei]|uniref:exo-alpha-sialidase n=1 Tax=Streptomyces griseiscabiei TaxID=2993540 RepID=A0ABU4LDD9_9ACTN|nr:FG-GAP-like repeat-containing protein [Streptomyces griseiscabiei]MBZ3900324.1 exo-alpha-sialidase [Streptomyces griseiscabiei]MDX2913335.1 exo-alpha-sialidase [Streptomyces griseiscabiei]
MNLSAVVRALLLPLVAGVALVSPAPATAAPVITAQPPQLPSQSTLFTSNTTIGGRTYTCFRVPSLVSTGNGTLIAFAEARMSATCDDKLEMDIVSRTSTDGGATWTSPQIIARSLSSDPANLGVPAINAQPTPIVDATYKNPATGAVEGQVVLLYSVRLLTNGTINGPDGKPNRIQTFAMYSHDDGRTWGGRTDITSQVNPAQSNQPDGEQQGVRFFLPGPGHGIQLRPTPAVADGRLLAPAYQNGRVDAGGDWVDAGIHHASAIYSDNHGQSWQRGKITPNTDRYVGEPSIAQLSNGHLYMTSRNNQNVTNADSDASSGVNRNKAISTDGGASWEPATAANLPGARVFAPVLSLNSVPRGDSFNQLVITEPVSRDTAHPARQGTLRLRSSFDDGVTWQTPAQGLAITRGGAGYSDITRTTSGGLGVIYEAGPAPKTDPDNVYDHTSVRFTNVSAGQTALPGPVTGARTPDTAGGNAAVLRGRARLTDGRFGRALTLSPDTSAGFVDVAPSPAYASLSGDFTAAADFKYNSTTGLRSILWGFGVGAGLPQLWIRAEPENNRIVANATTASGSRNLTSTSSYNDNAWHHVALVRSGQELSLWIDGTEVDTDTAPSGAVSPARPQPLQVGNRLDGAQPFSGSLDSVVLYDRALSAQEISAAAASDTYSGTGRLLHLPFETGEADTRSWDDTDGDGQLDVLNRASDGNLWYFAGFGDATTGERHLENRTLIGGTFGSSFHPARGDFNNDGLGDLIAIDDQGRLNFWLGQGDGTLSAPAVLMSGTSFSSVKAVSGGDFNADGLTDIVGLGFDGSLWWWPGNGDRTFGARQNLVSGTAFAGYSGVPTGDFDDDGRTDVAAVDSGGTLWWWKGNGNGGLGAAQQLASGTSFAAYSRFFTGDVDSDGHTDFAAVDSSGAARWWPGDGAGHVSGTARTLTVLSPVAGTTPALLNGGVYTF